ncbi:MAG TPA: formylglycine-generating enzyme family protein [Pyrinomonadaceae bacterium]|nr:formylglycine-generating enzyme family protein [Pyrinomonadaceae bacterium]
MKRASVSFKFITLALIAFFVISTLSFISLATVTTMPQGKGGTIKPAPTPTPATTRTTSPKKSPQPAKASRTGASKLPDRKAEPGAARTSAAEIAFWETIKTSTNPDDFREYLRKYPNGEFAGLARNRLNALEEAKRKEEEEAAKKRPGAVVKNSLGMELVLIPAGTFMMGSEKEENQKPVHRVIFSKEFYMGKYEVKQAEWQKVMGANPSKVKGDNLPVETVSWKDAQDFIRVLNAMNDGYIYHLPSEAEWEYACRAGATGEGDTENIGGLLTGKMPPQPVGSKQPNAWGLYDMLGNVLEWCEDMYHDGYEGAPADGSAWVSGTHSLNSGDPTRWKIQRGIRFTFRGRTILDDAHGIRGFRVAAVARPR